MHGEEWDRLISASGIIEFGGFFKEAWINRMADLELESEVQRKIIIAMMNFLKTRDVKHSQRKVDLDEMRDTDAYKEFQEEISRCS